MVDKTLLANLARQKNLEQKMLSITHENRRAEMMELLQQHARIAICNARTKSEISREVIHGKS